MNRTFLLRLLFCSIVAHFTAAPALAQTQLRTSTQTTAGGTALSSSFSLLATIGQSSPPGLASSTQFSLTGGFIVTLGNTPPAVANVIANQTLTSIGATFTRDLNASPVVFSDPDGDALTYTANSSSTAIATANVSGSTLTVTAVAVGNATITVTADDKNSNAISITFSVAVSLTANRPPVVASAIANQSLTAGGAPFVRDLNATPAVFNDPDNDALSYTASSSVSAVATAAISGSTLTVTPVAAGSATLTLTANDNKGGSVSTTFSVTVIAVANRAPTVTSAIANQTLSIGGAPFSRNLNAAPAVFTDPDGDVLSYTASSSAANIATASLSGSTLTVAPVAVGTATITITANDGRGGSAPTSFGVTVTSNQAPTITPTALSAQPIGPINVQADVTDDLPNFTVQLQYRPSGALTSTSIAMTLVSGNTYRATIPVAAVTSSGVEYAILATDAGSAQTRAPADAKKFFSIPISIVSETKPNAQPGGTAANAYRLISAPFQLTDPSALAMLQDDLGSYANSVWRLFGLDPGQPLTNKSPYVEVSQNGSFAPGKSFFLIVNASRTIDAGPGQTIRTDQEFSIALLPGHNFVASPFNFSVPISKLRLQSGLAFSLQTFNGTWTPITDVISPWEGYYLPNNGGNDVLLVEPNLTASAQPRAAEAGWRLQISATSGEARDLYNFAGVAPASADNWDDQDVPEPPPIGDFVSVYFPHPEWAAPVGQKLFQRYTNDMRSATSANHRWNFSVETSLAGETVSLKFDGLQDVAPDLSVFLVDAELNYKQNLREHAAYRYQPRGSERPKDFTLLVGKADFVDGQTAGVQGVPEDFVLEQNFPNPFGGGGAYLLQSEARTMIRFGLPAPSVVTIKVFDLAGREVATVLEKVEMPPGLHQRGWDGRDASGRLVPNGIYFYRLAAGNVVRTMKMMVIR